MSRAYEQETPGQNVEAESQLMAADGFGSLSRDTFRGSELTRPEDGRQDEGNKSAIRQECWMGRAGEVGCCSQC